MPIMLPAAWALYKTGEVTIDCVVEMKLSSHPESNRACPYATIQKYGPCCNDLRKRLQIPRRRKFRVGTTKRDVKDGLSANCGDYEA